MWAQGLTIGIIIAAVILTHSQRAKVYEEEDERRVRHLVSGNTRRLERVCNWIFAACRPLLAGYFGRKREGAHHRNRRYQSSPVGWNLGCSRYTPDVR